MLLERESTPYLFLYPSHDELCSQIHIHSVLGLLALIGVVVLDRGSTPYPSLYPSSEC